MRNFSIQNIQRICLTLGATLLVVLGTTQASAQVIFSDDFSGTGNVDTTKWRLPFGPESGEGNFVGRTQYRGDTAVDMPQQVGGNAELHLDTYSIVDPGNAFLGHDLLTKRNFAVGGGLTIESTLRLAPSAAQSATGGQVGGFFMFDNTGTGVRDEIDVELLGNEVVSGNNRVGTNNWNDGTFASGGDFQLHAAGVDLTQFNDYKMEWTPDVIKWYVNNNLVRVQTEDVPDDPMKLHFNVWAPDSSFSEAFDAALQPTAVEANNTRYTLQVDDVSVTRRNTNTSANLLTNGGFESVVPNEQPIGFDSGLVSDTDQNRWLVFNNDGQQTYVFLDDPDGLDPGVPDAASEGFFMGKLFGPFSGAPNSSGMMQNVAASPGDVFEASIDVQTAGGDSILGNENFTELKLEFLDAGGSVIPENSQVVPIIDGRDVNAPGDTWVNGTVNAIAPVGTTAVRFLFLFTQLNNEGGSAWIDSASLVRLDTASAPTLAGDFNNDGTVDAADYTVWRDNLGNGSEASLNGNGDGLDGVDAGDYALWAANFGNTASSSSTAAAVPEPSAGVLLLAGLLLCKRRK